MLQPSSFKYTAAAPQDHTAKDFRAVFAGFDDLALVNIDELALLLCTSRRSVEQMRFRQALPPTAQIPGLRRCLWTAGSLRAWLLHTSQSGSLAPEAALGRSEPLREKGRRPGRPRKPLIEI